MTVATGNLTAWMSEFVATGAPPGAARDRAAIAVCDTVRNMNRRVAFFEKSTGSTRGTTCSRTNLARRPSLMTS